MRAPTQMTYDPRRLRTRGFITRIPHTQRYTITDHWPARRGTFLHALMFLSVCTDAGADTHGLPECYGPSPAVLRYGCEPRSTIPRALWRARASARSIDLTRNGGSYRNVRESLSAFGYVARESRDGRDLLPALNNEHYACAASGVQPPFMPAAATCTGGRSRTGQSRTGELPWICRIETGGSGPDVGSGLSFQVSIQARMSVLSWRTERWVPRRSFLVVSSANQRSTRLSQEELVGVKCRTKRGWRPASV